MGMKDLSSSGWRHIFTSVNKLVAFVLTTHELRLYTTMKQIKTQRAFVCSLNPKRTKFKPIFVASF
jgi:hypothetical protein